MDTTYLSLGIILIGLGFLLLAAEVVLPSHGVLPVAGLATVGGGVVLLFHHDTWVGYGALAACGLALPLGVGLGLSLWPHTPLGRRWLKPAPSQNDTLASLPARRRLEALRGRFGRTRTALRPAGAVDFGGVRIDAISDGKMVEAGRWVRCVDVRDGRVVVRLEDVPPGGPGPDLERDLAVWRPDPEPDEL